MKTTTNENKIEKISINESEYVNLHICNFMFAFLFIAIFLQEILTIFNGETLYLKDLDFILFFGFILSFIFINFSIMTVNNNEISIDEYKIFYNNELLKEIYKDYNTQKNNDKVIYKDFRKIIKEYNLRVEKLIEEQNDKDKYKILSQINN